MMMLLLLRLSKDGTGGLLWQVLMLAMPGFLNVEDVNHRARTQSCLRRTPPQTPHPVNLNAQCCYYTQILV